MTCCPFGWCQAIISTNSGLLYTGPMAMGINFGEILIKLLRFSFNNICMYSKMPTKWQPSYPVLVLKQKPWLPGWAIFYKQTVPEIIIGMTGSGRIYKFYTYQSNQNAEVWLEVFLFSCSSYSVAGCRREVTERLEMRKYRYHRLKLLRLVENVVWTTSLKKQCLDLTWP